MVRRSTVDRSPQPAVYSAGSDAGAGDLAQTNRGSRKRGASSWRGAGGRWLVWTFRVVVWLVLLDIGYCGVVAIVVQHAAPGPPPAGRATAPARALAAWL